MDRRKIPCYKKIMNDTGCPNIEEIDGGLLRRNDGRKVLYQ